MSKRSDASGWLKDGNLAFDGGVDGGRSPSFLQRNQTADAINTTGRGGFARPRPGIRKVALNFTGDTANPFQRGRFQHGAFYDGNDLPMLLSSQGGRQFKIDLLTFKVTEISPPGLHNSAERELGWSVQAENYWIYQDNQSSPIIFDGGSSRRASDVNSEVPVGNVMAYTMGRLVVSLTDRQTFRVGDLVFGQGSRSDMLRFTENNFLNEGGDFVARVFGAPSNSGPIKAMRALAMGDTQLGQGPLLVGTPRQVFTVNLPFDRTQWKAMTSPLQTVNEIVGPQGQDAFILINTDIWYRGLDGWRSYIMARREFGSWGNTPMSSEINPVISQDTEWLLEHCSAVLHHNRMLGTCSPVPSTHGVWHRGMAVIDFDHVSSLQPKTNPTWEGIWTGPRILQLVAATVNQHERLFIYALDEQDNICLYEMVADDKDDDGVAIAWSMDTPSYACGQPDGYKKLETGRVVLNELSGALTGVVRYRSDQNPCWQDWDNFAVCAQNQDCADPGDCVGPHTFNPQVRSPIRLHTPPDDFDPVSSRKWRTGYEFQARLELTGYAAIKAFRIYAMDEPEQLGVDRRDVT